ncbi:MAG TPA: FAD:protein FMN transferase [Thermoleophilia bacterium]|nr:FAD:protein FMN transferase [Thermoleophilia bacterium]
MQHTEQVMGTAVSILVIDEPASETPDGNGNTPRAPADAAPATAVEAALARAVAELHYVDHVFSTWQPDSPMSRLRRGEIAVADAPPDVGWVLELCDRARGASGGWFDPWRLPGGVDPTGLVKGWAAELALAELRRAGVRNAMVNAGGDIAVLGEPEPGQPWRVGLRHPLDGDALMGVVELRGEQRTVATSGAYERGPHVLDASTGGPAQGLLAATVVGPDLAFVDALATGLFASGGRALARVAGQRGFSALIVSEDGSFKTTPGFPLVAPVTHQQHAEGQAAEQPAATQTTGRRTSSTRPARVTTAVEPA